MEAKEDLSSSAPVVSPERRHNQEEGKSSSKSSCRSSAKSTKPLSSSKKSHNRESDHFDHIDSPAGVYSSDQKRGRESSSSTERCDKTSFNEAKHSRGTCGSTHLAPLPDADVSTIGKGLRINSMTMKDAENKKLLWAQNCRDTDLFDGTVHEAHVPVEILQCNAVTRTINFTSTEKITSFSLIQKVLLHGSCIETWSFQFGFVIPGSTNSWEQTIYSVPKQDMIPAEVLSGNLIFETIFFNSDEVVAKTSMKIFYD